ETASLACLSAIRTLSPAPMLKRVVSARASKLDLRAGDRLDVKVSHSSHLGHQINIHPRPIVCRYSTHLVVAPAGDICASVDRPQCDREQCSQNKNVADFHLRLL